MNKKDPLWVTVRNMNESQARKFYNEWDSLVHAIAAEYKGSLSSKDAGVSCKIIEFMIGSGIMQHVADAIVAGYSPQQIRPHLIKTVRRLVLFR